MKDIKELIYAAVEENALKFQEIVNNQLQVRAYDAIEALRPEVGASMFGESSHKKMDDEDEEEMEDEDEDEEDEDEMDDKKKSMKEALHPNQQKIDVVDDEKIDAKDFAKLRKTKNEETQKNIFRNPNLPAKDQLKNPPKQIKVKEEVEAIDESVFDSKDAAQSVVNKLKTKHDDGNYDVKADNGKHRVVHAYYPNSTVKKQIARLKEEVEQIDEIGNTPAGRAALGKLAAARDGRADWARGVAKHGSVGSDAAKHNALADKDRAVAKKAAGKAGIDHRTSPSTNYDHDKHGGYGTDKPNPADKFAARNKPKMEEVEQVNERSREDMTSQIKGLKKTAIKHGFDWPTNDSTDNVSTKDLKSFHKSARSVIKKDLKAKADVQEVADKVVADKVRTRGSFKFFSKKKLPGSDKSSMNEVAMPKNAADWQALITHQIQTTGHPVATDAQFRAQNCKDTSKIASLEPGQDALQYATAQGGTVKLP